MHISTTDGCFTHSLVYSALSLRLFGKELPSTANARPRKKDEEKQPTVDADTLVAVDEIEAGVLQDDGVADAAAGDDEEPQSDAEEIVIQGL